MPGVGVGGGQGVGPRGPSGETEVSRNRDGPPGRDVGFLGPGGLLGLLAWPQPHLLLRCTGVSTAHGSPGPGRVGKLRPSCDPQTTKHMLG